MPIHKFIKPKNKGVATFIQFSGIGLQMGLTIFFMNWFGKYLDQKLDHKSVNYTNILTLLAVFASTYSIIRQVQKFGENSEKSKNENN
jgi:hypothetical protein